MKYFKIITLSLGFGILSLLMFTGIANAQNFKSGAIVTVSKNETVDNMLFATGDNIDIAGTVNGDVFCAGKSITISGNVDGDIFCAGQNIVISGKVSGSARVAGQDVNISGDITGSASVATQNLTVDSNGKIGSDLLGGSQNITLNGLVGRDIMAGSEKLSINGTVGRNINGEVNQISVGSLGVVKGLVDFTGSNDPIINNGGQILGKVTRTAPKEQEQNNTNTFEAMVGFFMYLLAAMLFLAIALVILMPRIFETAATDAQKSPGQTILIGAAATFLIPATIGLLFMTLIGVPLAILLVLAWVAMTLLIAPFTSYLLGKALFNNLKKPIWIMASGTVLLIVLWYLPLMGFVAAIATYLFGTGMILTQGKKLLVRSSIKKQHVKK